jgi:hypothetical protein
MHRFALCTILVAAACAPPDGPRAAFRLKGRDPVDVPFGAAPWPSDLHVGPGGKARVWDFPNPKGSSLVEEYKEVFEREFRGWGTQAGVFFFFDRPLDPESIDGAVWIVEVRGGRRLPADARFFGEHPFLPANTLVAMPYPGFPLRDGRSYVFALQDSLRDREGRGAIASDGFRDVRDARAKLDDPALERARGVLSPALAALEGAGLVRDRVVSASVVTTQPIVERTAALVRALEESDEVAPAAWQLASLVRQPEEEDFRWFWMQSYDSMRRPSFQREATGDLVFDEEGRAVVQAYDGYYDCLFVPEEPPRSPQGHPVALYLSRDGACAHLPRAIPDAFNGAGFALVSLNYAPRLWGAGETAAVIAHPVLGRDTFLQGVVDVLASLRALRSPRAVFPEGHPLDMRRIVIAGQYQGGLAGLIAAAFARDVAAAAFASAGGGALLFAFPEAERPEGWEGAVSAPGMLLDLLGVTPETADRWHPLAHLAQTFFEPADPANYARLLAREPLEGHGRTHALFVQGLRDVVVSPAAGWALAFAAGADWVEDPWGAPPQLAVSGLAPLAAPVRLNLDGAATVALSRHDLDFAGAGANAGVLAEAVHFLTTGLEGAAEVRAR